jgi:hypothetical protein
MRRRVVQGVLAVMMAALAAAACDKTPTEPDPGPLPIQVTEKFSGTLTKNGAVIFPFPVEQIGTVTATISALLPDPPPLVGLSVGMWSGTTCQVVLDSAQASRGSMVSGDVNAAGMLCARIYDSAGTLTEPATFELTVTHY